MYKAIKYQGKKKDYHRHIMELSIGRKLHRNEVVHHIDEDKLNNNLDNLMIMTRSEHSRMHRMNTTTSEVTKEKLRILGRRNRGTLKLSHNEVREIKSLLGGHLSYSAIASKYNVSKSTIFQIKKGQSWSEV